MDNPLDKQIGGDHYKNFAIQPIEFIIKNKLNFSEGCIVKYICRYKQKGSAIDDLLKVIHYAELLINDYQENEKASYLNQQRTRKDSEKTARISKAQSG
jgi:predicted RNase H-like nuclease